MRLQEHAEDARSGRCLGPCQGNEVGGGTPEEFAALMRAERPRWAKVVRDAKIEPE
ncbi:MAG: hypothetical protein ACKO5J_10725 [Rubrivivax sp.]